MSESNTQTETQNQSDSFDYTFVHSPARIALYDDMRTAPRITEIQPAPTAEFIEKLTTTIYDQSHMAGGSIPYTPIREVTENFIHARFSEIIVSILDKGNTIRFADQGPGIQQKDKAQLPGFSSAIEPMKRYIRGVGSGLPLVKEYLDFSNGSITIEDNLNTGSVVTISLEKEKYPTAQIVITNPQIEKPVVKRKPAIPSLSEREINFIRLLYKEGELRVTDFVKKTGISNSTVYSTLAHLEKLGLVQVNEQKRRSLSPEGEQIAENL